MSSTATLERDDLRDSEGDPLAPAYHPGHSTEHQPEHEAPRHRTGSHRLASTHPGRRRGVLSRLLTLSVWTLGALGLVLAALHLSIGAGAFVELSDSMSPQYRSGDLVLTRLEAPAALEVGDVIAVTPPGHTTRVAHRIVAISGPSDAPVLTTRGDANPVADAWHITARADVSVAVADLPGAGRVVTMIHSDALRALLVLVLGLGLTALVLRRMLPSAAPAVPPSAVRTARIDNQPARSTDQEIE